MHISDGPLEGNHLLAQGRQKIVEAM
jgi:hypothetical protein